MKKERTWQVFLALIGALIPGFLGYWLGNRPEPINTVTYYKSVSKNLVEVKGSNNIKLTYSNKTINNISEVSYIIGNTSKVNFNNLKIYFVIEDKKNIPLFHSFRVPDRYPKDAISLISENNGKYIFEIDYLNRTKNLHNNKAIEFNFYFKNDNVSPITLKAGNEGISIKKYTVNDRNELISGIILSILGEMITLIVYYEVGKRRLLW